MNIMKDNKVKKYISSLNGKSSCHHVPTYCQCIQKSMPSDAHAEDAEPFSINLAQLTFCGSQKYHRTLSIYITKKSFLNGGTMIFLIRKMLDCKIEEEVFKYYQILDQNFRNHPPCAPYMFEEYENLFFSPDKNPEKMSLWDYLIDTLNCIVNGDSVYGNNPVFDFAFKKFFNFFVCILQMNDEVSKSNNSRSLLMKCLNYNTHRRTRMRHITKLIDQLSNTGYDFHLQLINLAILVNQLMNKPNE